MSKKKPFLAALIAGTGALLLLMQSGYLPGLRRRLREKKAACCKTAEVASAYVVREKPPLGKAPVGDSHRRAAPAPVLYGNGHAGGVPAPEKAGTGR